MRLDYRRSCRQRVAIPRRNETSARSLVCSGWHLGKWRRTKFSKEVIKWIIAVLANGVETLDESRRADARVSHPTRDHFLEREHRPFAEMVTLVSADGFFHAYSAMNARCN